MLKKVCGLTIYLFKLLIGDIVVRKAVYSDISKFVDFIIKIALNEA